LASLTIENYVKAIYQIMARKEEKAATTGELAESLGVSPGTVTSMLKTLSEGGLARYVPYEGAKLTDAGRSLALRVLRRHRLIELFLVRTLNLTWDEVHEEAENMEHAVSDLLIDRIDAYLGYPASDPHGDPIPKADGTIARSTTRRLSDLSVGDRFRIGRVLEQSSDFLRYLTEAGLGLGAEGLVESMSMEAGVIALQVGKNTTTSRSAADRLLVEPLDSNSRSRGNS
jgi:DtxR family transcriptional regulator, Mn-dependent transcriptional regulator